MRGLHQRGLAHAARAPKQRVVGGQALWQSARYFPSARRALRSMPLSSDISTRLRGPRLPAGCRRYARHRHRRRRNPAAPPGAAPAARARWRCARAHRPLGLPARICQRFCLWRCAAIWASTCSLLAMDVLFRKCAALSRAALLSQAGASENRLKTGTFAGLAAFAMTGGRYSPRNSNALQGGDAARALHAREMSMFGSPAFAQGLFGGGAR